MFSWYFWYMYLFFLNDILQVEVQVEAIDKAGNFIGWLFVDNTNLSVALVEVKESFLLAY